MIWKYRHMKFVDLQAWWHHHTTVILTDVSHRNIRNPPDPHSMRFNTQHNIKKRDTTAHASATQLHAVWIMRWKVKWCCVYLLFKLLPRWWWSTTRTDSLSLLNFNHWIPFTVCRVCRDVEIWTTLEREHDLQQFFNIKTYCLSCRSRAWCKF